MIQKATLNLNIYNSCNPINEALVTNIGTKIVPVIVCNVYIPIIDATPPIEVAYHADVT